MKWRMISISLTSGIAAQVLAVARSPSSLRGVDLGHVERRQLVGLLAGRGLLEDEAFVLVDVAWWLS